MGRQLLEGLPSIKLFGEKIAVRAEICSFKFMSSHADRDGLLAWLKMQGEKPRKVFLMVKAGKAVEKEAKSHV